MNPEKTDFVMVNGWKRVRLLVRELQQQQNFKQDNKQQQQYADQDNIKQQQQGKQETRIMLRHSNSVRTPTRPRGKSEIQKSTKLLRPRDQRLGRHSLPFAFNVNLFIIRFKPVVLKLMFCIYV